MKNNLLFALIALSCVSYADEIPFSIENVIAAYDTRTRSLEDGVLTIKYNRRVLNIDTAKAMFDGLCTDYSMHKWKPQTIKSLRLLNVSLDQGYEINAGGRECANAGKMTPAEATAYKASFIKLID